VPKLILSRNTFCVTNQDYESFGLS